MTGDKNAASEQAVGGDGVKKKGRVLSTEERRLMVPGGCRAYMRKTLVKEFPGIVQGFVKAAKTGSCPHVKLVTELMRPIRQGTPRQKKGPAVRFLEKLDKEYAEREEQERLEFERLEVERVEQEREDQEEAEAEQPEQAGVEEQAVEMKEEVPVTGEPTFV